WSAAQTNSAPTRPVRRPAAQPCPRATVACRRSLRRLLDIGRGLLAGTLLHRDRRLRGRPGRVGAGGTVVHRAERVAGLDLVGRTPRLLLLEFVARHLRQVVALLLFGGHQPPLEAVDALLERRDPRGELAGVDGHALAGALDPDPAALRLLEGGAEVLEA